MGDLSLFPNLFIYSVIYFFQHGFMDICFIFWIIIQYYFVMSYTIYCKNSLVIGHHGPNLGVQSDKYSGNMSENLEVGITKRRMITSSQGVKPTQIVVSPTLTMAYLALQFVLLFRICDSLGLQQENVFAFSHTHITLRLDLWRGKCIMIFTLPLYSVPLSYYIPFVRLK